MSNAELNKMASDAVIYLLADIHIPNLETIYICANGSPIWNGNQYQEVEFDMEDLGFTSKSEVPEWVIKFSNINRVFEAYLQQYDLFLKQNGIHGNDINIDIRFVSSKELNNLEPIQHFKATLNQPSTNSLWATFRLSPRNPYNKTFPPRKILKNFCGWKFKSPQCGYVGSEVFCDKTLTTCRKYNNSPRFGGFIGVGARGLQLVK